MRVTEITFFVSLSTYKSFRFHGYQKLNPKMLWTLHNCGQADVHLPSGCLRHLLLCTNSQWSQCHLEVAFSLSKGKLILKTTTLCLQFPNKMKENNSTWGNIVVKSNCFVHFLEELKIPKKKHFKINWPFSTQWFHRVFYSYSVSQRLICR